MAISCVPEDLTAASKCYCFGTEDNVIIYLLVTWANGGIPPESGVTLGNPDEGWSFGNPDEGWVFGSP